MRIARTSLAVLCILWGRKISVEQKNLTNNYFLRLLELELPRKFSI